MTPSFITRRSAPLDVEHVVERVVERPQVRVHLLLERARQEAELLAGLDRRAGQHDALHLLVEQRAHRQRHRQVGLAGAGRAHAEDDVVLREPGRRTASALAPLGAIGRPARHQDGLAEHRRWSSAPRSGLLTAA
jgi:hypothetical protein